jgi:NADH pyrophosphatase NudC (nudix superfamily)
LGVVASQDSQGAYIGYQEDFFFCYLTSKIGHPLEDEVAKLFFEPSNQVAVSLLKGHTAAEASVNSRNYFARNICMLLNSQATNDASQYVRYLMWDMKHQICLGNGAARF